MPDASGEDLPDQRGVSLRLVTVIAVEQSEEQVMEWCYLDMEQLKERRQRRAGE